MKPNKKHDHVYVYAILRYDEFLEPYGEDFTVLTVVKVVEDPDYADQEVKRLNQLNQGKGCRYKKQVTRFDRNAPKV